MSTLTQTRREEVTASPDVCPTCGITLWAWRKKEHKCPPVWWCWVKDEQCSGRLVYAYHQHAAATKYAAKFDQDQRDAGDPPMCDQGGSIMVATRQDGRIQPGGIMEFYVWAELEPRYMARHQWREGNGTA